MTSMAIYKIFQGISLFLTIINWLLIAYVIMSWIIRPSSPVFQFVSRFSQPILAPFRPIARMLIKKGFMIDVSPFLAFLSISILRNLLYSLYSWILTRM